MPKGFEWFPKESGAIQPRSRSKDGGQMVYCGYCQCAIYVTDFGYGVVTQTECPSCFRVLQKNQLILDLVKWRKFNGLDVNHAGNIKVDERKKQTGTIDWYQK